MVIPIFTLPSADTEASPDVLTSLHRVRPTRPTTVSAMAKKQTAYAILLPHGDSFDTQVNVAKGRLRTAINNELFGKDMQVLCSGYLPLSPSLFVSRLFPCWNFFTECVCRVQRTTSSVRYEENHDELEDIMQENSKIPLPKSMGIKQWLVEAYQSSRGIELVTFDVSLLPIIWKKQSSNWEALVH